MFWAVIPIKDLERSLRRLSPVLSAWERRRLLAAMLEDVISSVIQVKALDVAAVVAAGGEVVDVARRHGVAWIQEVENRGHSIAVADAAARLARNGVQTILTITADVPLVRPSELESVILQHPPAPA